MLTLKLTQIGNSLGVILPKEMLKRMKLEKGDVLCVTETPDNGFHISPYDSAFEQEMSAARSVMRQRRNVLRTLNK